MSICLLYRLSLVTKFLTKLVLNMQRICFLTWFALSLAGMASSISIQYSQCIPVLFPSVEVKTHRDCIATIPMLQCVGACVSTDKYPMGFGKTDCRCCLPIQFEDRNIKGEALCGGKKASFSITIKEPRRCECQNCRSGN